MRAFLLAIVFMSFNFLFAQPEVEIELEQDDPYVWIQVYEEEQMTHEFIIEKTSLKMNLNSFKFERVDLFTNLDYFSNQENPTEFFDFEDGVAAAILKKNILEEMYDRENSESQDRISIIKFILKKDFLASH